MNKITSCLLAVFLTISTDAAAMLTITANIQIELGGRDIGSAISLDISDTVFSCNNPRMVTAAVIETIIPRAPFGPVQHLEITLTDNNPPEQPLCDVAGDVRFEVPVGVLKAPIITTRVTLRDRVPQVGGSIADTTEELSSPTLRLDRPLRSVTVPANPTTLDDIVMLFHSAGIPSVRQDDRITRLLVANRQADSEADTWRVQTLDLGPVPAGYSVDRFTRIDLDAYFDLVDAGLASEPGGTPISSIEFQEFVQVEHRVPLEASGSWYNPDTAGRGLSIQVLDDARLIAYWYRFDSQGNPVWLFGDGQVLPADPQVPGIQVSFEGFLSNAPGDSGELALTPWGTWQIHFTACDRAIFTWQPALAGFESGSESIQQLAGIGGQDCARRRRSPIE